MISSLYAPLASSHHCSHWRMFYETHGKSGEDKVPILQSHCLGWHPIFPVRPWSSVLISLSLFSYLGNQNNNCIF